MGVSLTEREGAWSVRLECVYLFIHFYGQLSSCSSNTALVAVLGVSITCKYEVHDVSALCPGYLGLV